MVYTFWVWGYLVRRTVRHNEIRWIWRGLIDGLHDWHDRKIPIDIFFWDFIFLLFVLVANFAFVDASIWLVRDGGGNFFLPMFHLYVVGFDLFLFVFDNFFMFPFLKLFLTSSFLNLLIEDGLHLSPFAFELLFLAVVHFLEQNTSNVTSVLQFLHSWRVIHCYINLRNYNINSFPLIKEQNLKYLSKTPSLFRLCSCVFLSA